MAMYFHSIASLSQLLLTITFDNSVNMAHMAKIAPDIAPNIVLSIELILVKSPHIIAVIISP
jgi:hypothetical protein